MFLLLFAQILGDLYVHRKDQISPTVGIVHKGNALLSESERRSRLCSLGNGELLIPLQRGNLDLRTQGRLDNGQRDLTIEIVAVSLKEGMLLDHHGNDQIARRSAVSSVTALTAKRDPLTVVDSRRNVHAELLVDLYIARSLAVGARRLDDLTRSATAVAGCGGLECHTAHTLGYPSLSRAAADRTGLGAGSLLRAASAAIRAFLNSVIGHVLLDAKRRLLKAHADAYTNILASGRGVSSLGATAEAASEEAAENVSQISKVAKATKAATVSSATCGRIKCGMAELVILCLLVRIGQNGVCLIDFLEACLRLCIPRMQVGMVFFCQGAVCLLDRRLVGGAIDSQHLVIISFICHSCSSKSFAKDTLSRERAKFTLSRYESSDVNRWSYPRNRHYSRFRRRPAVLRRRLQHWDQSPERLPAVHTASRKVHRMPSPEPRCQP